MKDTTILRLSDQCCHSKLSTRLNCLCVFSLVAPCAMPLALPRLEIDISNKLLAFENPVGRGTVARGTAPPKPSRNSKLEAVARL